MANQYAHYGKKPTKASGKAKLTTPMKSARKAVRK
jgi:hypothetical protein